MLAKLKSNPVTTLTGWLALASGWLSQQTMLDHHPSFKQVLQVLASGAVAAFAYYSSDAKKE